MREWKEAPDAAQAYRQLWDYALAVRVSGSEELVAYEYCLNHLSKVRDLRMERVAQLSLSVSWYTWTVLSILGSSLVVLASFLACASRRARVWEVGLLALTLALLLTLIADVTEDFRRSWIRNARKVGFEEPSERFAIRGRVEHTVDIVEYLDLTWPRLACGRTEVFLRSGLTIGVDPTGLADGSV